MAGITIAFICVGNKDTVTSYNNFGKKYWDDTHDNKSKIGYYFIYYYQKKYVYIHKIINILPHTQRPSDMTWNSTRQILCLGPQLMDMTWNEWIHFGTGAPYANDYHMTQTSSWTREKLQKKFHLFNFEMLDHTIKTMSSEKFLDIMNEVCLRIKKDYIQMIIDADEICEIHTANKIYDMIVELRDGACEQLVYDFIAADIHEQKDNMRLIMKYNDIIDLCIQHFGFIETNIRVLPDKIKH